MTYEVIICILILLMFISILGLAHFFMDNPHHSKPIEKPRGYPTVQQIKELNAQYAAQRAKKDIEVERGKLLAFRRKPWYKSNRGKK